MDAVASIMHVGTMILGGVLLVFVLVVVVYLLARRATRLRGS